MLHMEGCEGDGLSREVRAVRAPNIRRRIGPRAESSPEQRPEQSPEQSIEHRAQSLEPQIQGTDLCRGYVGPWRTLPGEGDIRSCQLIPQSPP